MTTFLQVSDNSSTRASVDSLNNTTNPITLSGIDTTKFVPVTTGFAVTIWDDETYIDPADDPNMEKALVTAATINATGSLTLNRPFAKVHTGTPRIALLVIAQHINDHSVAINALEDKTSNIDNTSDLDKPVSTAQAQADSEVYNNAVLDAGTQADQAITNAFSFLAAVAFSGDKADVGLGNVDNTSDVNKPISTATQTALDTKGTKLNIPEFFVPARRTSGTGEPTGSYEISGNAIANTLAFRNANGTMRVGTPSGTQDATTKAYVDGLIAGIAAAYLLKAGDTMAGDLNIATGANLYPYNTVAGANYERGMIGWDSNEFKIQPQQGGSGSMRNMVIGPYGGVIMYQADSDSAGYLAVRRSASSGNSRSIKASSDVSASSGMQYLVTAEPGIYQTGTAGFTLFYGNATYISTGSGQKNLIDVGVNGVSKFKVDSSGNTTVATVIVNTNGDIATISTRKGANSDGNNIWIGGGGQSSIGDIANTYYGTYNVSLGLNALFSATTAYHNVAIAAGALETMQGGIYNVAIGFQSLGKFNGGTFLGRNVGIGYQTGFNNLTGVSNVFIGFQAGLNETTSNKLYISNSSTSTPLIYGDFAGKVLTINDILKLPAITAPAYSAGQLYFDAAEDALTFQSADPNVMLNLGQEQYIKVINNTGSTIGNGVPVYINGQSGGVATVAPALNTALTTARVVGVTTESIANGITGYVTRDGKVKGVNTSAFTAGAILYLGATAGSLTSTIPSASSAAVTKIGHVLVSNATTGVIQVELVQTPYINVQSATTELSTLLANTNVRLSGGAMPITTSATVTFSGALNTSQINTHSGGVREIPGNITATVTLTTFSARNYTISATGTTAIDITPPATTNAGHITELLRIDNNAAVVRLIGTFNGATNFTMSGIWKSAKIMTTNVSGTFQIWINN